MISIDTLTSDWTALSPAEQLAQWESFFADLDAGAAGFHRYYRVLMPRWDAGDVPDHVIEAQLARFEADMRIDTIWELQHPSSIDSCEDYTIHQLHASTADLELAELPY
jgi:hypothetical protein